MGECFLLINYDKKEYVSPFEYGEMQGAKLLECMWTDFAKVQTLLCYKSSSSQGRWAGDRVSLVGDGRDDYHDDFDGYKNITKEVVQEMKDWKLYDFKVQEETFVDT